MSDLFVKIFLFGGLFLVVFVCFIAFYSYQKKSKSRYEQIMKGYRKSSENNNNPKIVYDDDYQRDESQKRYESENRKRRNVNNNDDNSNSGIDLAMVGVGAAMLLSDNDSPGSSCDSGDRERE
jgi:ABC-type multidrug transport system fused ATPase/permease subunit